MIVNDGPLGIRCTEPLQVLSKLAADAPLSCGYRLGSEVNSRHVRKTAGNGAVNWRSGDQVRFDSQPRQRVARCRNAAGGPSMIEPSACDGVDNSQ
jgi:hypothetical protein